MLVNSNFNFHNQNSPQFKARLGQKQLTEVVDYASQNGCLSELSFCLKQLDKMKGKEAQIFIKQGRHFFEYRNSHPKFWAMHTLVVDGDELWSDVINRFTKNSHCYEVQDALARIAVGRLAKHNGIKSFTPETLENVKKYLKHNAGITAEKILKKFSIKENTNNRKLL